MLQTMSALYQIQVASYIFIIFALPILTIVSGGELGYQGDKPGFHFLREVVKSYHSVRVFIGGGQWELDKIATP